MRHSIFTRLRIALGIVVGLAIAASFPATTARAQHTVGIWDLSSWDYNGTSIATTTVNSSGPKIVGLSATSESSSVITLLGSLDGRITSVQPFVLVPAVQTSETLVQKFLLDQPVTFGPLASQSQFNTFIGINNGVGVAVSLDRIDLLTSYTLTLTVTGGGTFKAVDGTFADAPVIVGLDSQTVTLTWTTFTSPVILLNKIAIAGAITTFQASHDWQYLNTELLDVNAENQIAMIISNAPPEPPVVKAQGNGRINTTKRKHVLRGTSFDYNNDVLYIEIKVGNRGFRKASGIDNWRFVARGLKEGRNKVTIRAVDSTGAISGPDRVTIIRS
jgi:hypothetical protein